MVAVVKAFKIRGLVRAQNVWTKSLHTTSISANSNAEAALSGRDREGNTDTILRKTRFLLNLACLGLVS